MGGHRLWRLGMTALAGLLAAWLNAPGPSLGQPSHAVAARLGSVAATPALESGTAKFSPRPGRLVSGGLQARLAEGNPNVGLAPRGRRPALARLLEPTQPYVPVAGAGVTISFDRIVDQVAAQRSFSIDPPAKGTLGWLNERTLHFQPEAYAYETNYTVQVTTAGDDDAVWQWTFVTVKPITITLDDCGTPTQLRAVLSVLAEKHIKAIMFPIGWCAATYPWLVPQMLAEGHRVCNHTFSHPFLTTLTDAQIANEIRTGVHAGGCNLLRPPNGNWDERVARIAAQQGYQIYMWDVDTRDYLGATTAEILQAIRARGGVILMHFHGKYSIEALKQL